MGPSRGAPKIGGPNGGTPPDQEMLVTRLPAIRFCLNHDGFEYFSSLIYLAWFQALKKKRKIADFRTPGAICEQLDPFASIWSHPGTTGGGSKNRLAKHWDHPPGGVPPGSPPRGPPGDPKGPPGNPQETPCQFLNLRGIVRISDQIYVPIHFSPT